MTLTYHPGQVFHGRLDYIYPTLNPKTRVVQVRLIFNNPDLTLKPGMYSSVEMTPRVAADVVVVPKEAVIHSGRRNLAFVELPDHRFEPRTLTLGPQGDDGYQVLAGLMEGETVITSAQFLLDSESQLKEAINKLLEVRGQVLNRESPSSEGQNRVNDKLSPNTLVQERAIHDSRPDPAVQSGEGGGKGLGGKSDHPHPSPPPRGEGAIATRDAFTAYLKIQATFAGDHTATAATVEPLRSALNRLAEQPGSGVTRTELTRLATDLDHLASNDLQVARGGFGPVSELILSLAHGPGKVVADDLGLNAYHCPMSHANWLQKGKLANPYFGASMLRCGEPLTAETANGK